VQSNARRTSFEELKRCDSACAKKLRCGDRTFVGRSRYGGVDAEIKLEYSMALKKEFNILTM
jgi:hypothetical protein